MTHEIIEILNQMLIKLDEQQKMIDKLIEITQNSNNNPE